MLSLIEVWTYEYMMWWTAEDSNQICNVWSFQVCTPSVLVKKVVFGQRHGLQNTTLTSCFYKNIYWKVIYVYFYESIFQDKSIHIFFTFSNSTTWELFMIYISKVGLKPCPKRLPLRVRRKYCVIIAWKFWYNSLKSHWRIFSCCILILLIEFYGSLCRDCKKLCTHLGIQNATGRL
jgi:hypothetical protein